jgi:hypothetical protein
MANQDAQVQVQGEVPVVPAVAAAAAAAAGHGGRKVGARAWGPEEAMILAEVMHALHMDGNESEADPRWVNVLAYYKEQSKLEPRSKGSVRTHMADMLAEVRSAQMEYSRSDQPVAAPAGPIDWNDPAAAGPFLAFSAKVFAHMTQHPPAGYMPKWWNEQVFKFLHVMVFKASTKQAAAPAACAEQKSKFEQERDARTAQANADRQKRQRDEEELHENAKKMAVSAEKTAEYNAKLVDGVGELVKVLKQTFATPGTLGPNGEAEGPCYRLQSVEDEVTEMKENVAKLDGKLDTLILMMQQQQR